MDNFFKLHSKLQTEKPTPKLNVFTFGKYKGKTYDQVYQSDLPYVAYVMKADPKYFKRVQEYYRPLIIEDFKD